MIQVSIIGTGYVGLVSGTCFAEMGHRVTCIDIDLNKVELLKKGQSPIYEPGLDEMLQRNIENQRLSFSNDYTSCKTAQIVFLAVGTPSADSGEANLQYLKEACAHIAYEISENTVVVIKSTVPVGTHKDVQKWISAHTQKQFFVVNNPEFLKEGSAIIDFMKPDRVVIGADNQVAIELMNDLYRPLTDLGYPIFSMSNISAEMTKYAANCFLATKISFINDIARLCDATGADIEEVRQGITTDQRIGTYFLNPGPGYGGSCFPKDVQALLYSAKNHDIDLSIIRSAQEINARQKIYMAEKINDHFTSTTEKGLNGKTIAFWGVAFKPNTDDVRESPALDMMIYLLKRGANIRFHDPVAAKHFESLLARELKNDQSKGLGRWESCQDMYQALEGSDALCLMTEWQEYRRPDFKKISSLLTSQLIFDARNLYDSKEVLQSGFQYYAIGKKVV